MAVNINFNNYNEAKKLYYTHQIDIEEYIYSCLNQFYSFEAGNTFKIQTGHISSFSISSLLFKIIKIDSSCIYLDLVDCESVK